jgi:rifampin ADP-ribosylating transferase
MTDTTTYYHGTKANLELGDFIRPGFRSNYGTRAPGNFIYLSELIETATWGAELAIGDGRGRIYIVEPTGPIENDPNLTNKRFAGNPSRSFRSREPLRVIGEVEDWQGHSPEVLAQMHQKLRERELSGAVMIEE